MQDISAARLDKVRAIKELKSIDLAQLQQLLAIINSIQLGSEEQQVKAVDDSKAPSPEVPQQEFPGTELGTPQL